MKPPESRKAELAPNAMGGKKSRAEAAESAEFKMTELGPIPVDWEVKRLGEIFTFKNGYNASANCYGSGMPVASVLDALSNRPLLRQSIDTKVNAPYKDQDSFSLKFGDLIFTRSSETLEDVGRSNVYLDEGNAMFGGFVIRGRPSALIDSLFVNYMLNTSPCRIRVMSHGAGAQHFNIGQSGLEKVLIPLPPLAEQRRIARALSDVDELISALGKLIEKKRNIKTGAIQELLGMRNEECGMRNVPRRRLPGFSGEWVEKRLGDCFVINPSDERGTPDEFFYIDLESVSGGALSLKDKISRMNAPSRAQRRFKRFDVLFQTVRPYQCNNLYVDFDADTYVASTGYTIIRGTEMADTRFVYYTMHLNSFVKDVLDRCTGTSYPAINPRGLEEIIINIPPTLAEQKAIAAVLSDIDAEIAALEADRAKYERIQSGMMQELLTGKTRLKGE